MGSSYSSSGSVVIKTIQIVMVVNLSVNLSMMHVHVFVVLPNPSTSCHLGVCITFASQLYMYVIVSSPGRDICIGSLIFVRIWTFNLKQATGC